MNPSDDELTQAVPSFMFVALLTTKYIWQLLTEVEPVNSSPYSIQYNDILSNYNYNQNVHIGKPSKLNFTLANNYNKLLQI